MPILLGMQLAVAVGIWVVAVPVFVAVFLLCRYMLMTYLILYVPLEQLEISLLSMLVTWMLFRMLEE